MAKEKQVKCEHCARTHPKITYSAGDDCGLMPPARDAENAWVDDIPNVYPNDTEEEA